MAEKDYSDSVTLDAGGRSVTMTSETLKRAAESMEKFSVPHDTKFEESNYLDDARLDDIAAELIEEFDDFQEISGAKILYLWKRKGGKSNQRLKLGTCQKPSGLLAHYANTDFIICLAADHCRDYSLNAHQIRALIFHELKHADYDRETGQYVLIGHDFEGFAREIEEFGLWRGDAKTIAAAFKKVEQPTLFDGIGLAK